MMAPDTSGRYPRPWYVGCLPSFNPAIPCTRFWKAGHLLVWHTTLVTPTQSCPPCLRSRGRRESWAQENRDDRHFDDRPSRPGRCARSLGRLRSFPPPWSHPTTRCSRARSLSPCFCRRSRGANGTGNPTVSSLGAGNRFKKTV